MLNTIKNLAGAVLGGDDSRSEAAKKAAVTREKNAKQRSAAAKKAAATRTANAKQRSAAAKRGATTRSRRKARVDAMVDAVKRD